MWIFYSQTQLKCLLGHTLFRPTHEPTFIRGKNPPSPSIRHKRMDGDDGQKRWSRPVSRVLYALRRDSHSSRPGVTTWLQQPTREQRGPRYRPPIWSCSEWGLPCHATLSPRAVRSYRTVSPLPVPLRAIGGLLSVALAVSSRCPGVTWHSALRSPDFPRCAYARRDCPADSVDDYSGLTRGSTEKTQDLIANAHPSHSLCTYPSPLSPYSIFLGAPVIAAASLAAFAGGNSSRKIANTRCPSASFASTSSPRPATRITHSPRC